MLDLDRIAGAAVTQVPFPHFVLSDVLGSDALQRIGADFPAIAKPGLFTLDDVDSRGAFAALVEEIQGPQLADIIGKLFGVDLYGLPLMVTVRGQCARRDGRIHTDSDDKLITCLLYLNAPNWDATGGRLRLLRSGTNLDDMIAEVPPVGGTLIGFRRSHNSWHGHAPFAGPRRYVMFNWMTSLAVLSKNLGRHRISATFKRLGLFTH
jgi:hypothetical protein